MSSCLCTPVYEAFMDHSASPCTSLGLLSPAWEQESPVPAALRGCSALGRWLIPEQALPGLLHDVAEGHGAGGSVLPALGAVRQALQRGRHEAPVLLTRLGQLLQFTGEGDAFSLVISCCL